MKSILDLMNDINSNNIPHFLVFFGEEYEVMNIYIEKILSLGFERKTISTALVATQETNKKSLVKSNKCYIVVDDEDFIKQETKWEQVKDTFEHSKNILILKYNKLDKRSKFFKQNEDCIVEFEKLSDNVLKNYIQKKIELSDEMCERLIHICDNNYGRILLELDKIKQFQKATEDNDGKYAPKSILKNFIERGIIHQDIGDITFLLTDAIMMGDMENANKYLYQAKLKDEPVIMVLSILYDNFKNMLIIQGLGKEKPTEQNTGMKNGQIWAIKKKCGAYSNAELLRNLKVIRDIEVGLKSGKIDQDIALEYAVLEIMR